MAKSALDPCSCNKDGCSKSWDRDPMVEVECPTCEAEPGELCRRPSGHIVWTKKYPKGVHASRDMAALKAGAYGTCPLGKCPDGIEELDNAAKIAKDLEPDSVIENPNDGPEPSTQAGLESF